MATSVLIQLYNDICTQISDNITDIRHIDVDFGQDMQEHPALTYPAVLIDFPYIEYDQLAGGDTVGDIKITVKLIFKTISNSSVNTPDTYKTAALEYFEIEKSLKDLLHDWTPTDGYCSRLHIISAEGENIENKLRKRKLTFMTSF